MYIYGGDVVVHKCISHTINKEWNKNFFFTPNTFYSAIQDKKSSVKKTVRDSIGNLNKFYPADDMKTNKKISHSSDKSINDINHAPRYHNKRDIKIFSDWINIKMNSASTKEKQNFYTVNFYFYNCCDR